MFPSFKEATFYLVLVNVRELDVPILTGEEIEPQVMTFPLYYPMLQLLWSYKVLASFP